ncbi:MAG: bifunctional nuclease family protein [Bacteroidota bacterium]|nr:bifunctional nuclease family protein [Bacteroidota bacterium]
MKLIQLEIKALSYTETETGAYAMILNEIGGNRKLPIIIGGFEAQSIAIALDGEIKTKRPLTHDLFKSFSSEFKISLEQVIINKLEDGVFHSNLILNHKNSEKIIDARTSDAVALAIRFDAPIYTYESIMKIAGFNTGKSKRGQNISEQDWSENSMLKKGYSHEDLKNLSPAKLKSLLKRFVKSENYETAAIIRDEILKRESK